MQFIAQLLLAALNRLFEKGIIKHPPEEIETFISTCIIEQENPYVWTVTMKRHIIFLDIRNGKPEAYHSLPLSVWSAVGESR